MNDGDNRSGAFDLARQRLATEDADRSAWLTMAIKRDKTTERFCPECNTQLNPKHQGRYCKPCGNRVRERERRARSRAAAKAKLDAKGIRT